MHLLHEHTTELKDRIDSSKSSVLPLLQVFYYDNRRRGLFISVRFVCAPVFSADHMIPTRAFACAQILLLAKDANRALLPQGFRQDDFLRPGAGGNKDTRLLQRLHELPQAQLEEARGILTKLLPSRVRWFFTSNSSHTLRDLNNWHGIRTDERSHVLAATYLPMLLGLALVVVCALAYIRWPPQGLARIPQMVRI